MARSHLTLAALATSAVAGLDVRAASSFGSGSHGDFDSALVTGTDGRHWIVRVPTSERAQAEQTADLLALRGLSAGIRTRLPFSVTTFGGQVAYDGTQAVVYEFVYGSKVKLADLRAGDAMTNSIGRALAAIHTLPTSFIADAGLRVLTPHDILRSTITIVDRASATNLVPAALLRRWEQAMEDTALWQFMPTVVNGALTADSFLASDNEVTGVLGWHGLSVGDPARDLFWLLGASDSGVADTAFDAYNQTRGASDRQIKKRAMLYAELEIAKWLLHGTQQRSTEIVDDAVQMLHGLVDRVQNDLNQNISHNTMPIMAVDEVEKMLDERERKASD
ncbi:MAG: macrolide 2-phosphotransferase [Homoserinimonas sp.]|jgi:macrolide phosphotransferase|nr:macrolide 2-phosphotransferase [Homoserinimonas sp.]